MRTKRQQLYDDIYFGLEQDIFCFYRNCAVRRAVRGKKFGKEFYRSFRKEVVPYWKQFGIRPKMCWFKQDWLYRGYLDPRYIPKNIHYRRIIPYFNDNRFTRSLNDKNLNSLLFPTVKRPETIFKYIDGRFCDDHFMPIPEQAVYDRLAQPGNYVAKQTRDSAEGHNIQFLKGPLDRQAVEALLAKYTCGDFIVQRAVVQHPDLARLNASSLNTLRVETMLWHGKPYLLSAILRIGHPGSLVDNIAQGGYQAIVLPDGHLDKLAFTERDHGREFSFVEQTVEGVRFADNPPIPSWERVRDTALSLAQTLPHLRLIGWDFAVDEQGDPVLIEFNTRFNPTQENCGPTFGDMTDEVLSEIFDRRKQ